MNRLDLSDGFWKQFNVQNKSFKKQVGLYEVENISNTSILTIVIIQNNILKSIKIFQSIKTQGFEKEYSMDGFQKDLLHYMNIASRVNQKKLKKKDFR